ncbi:TolC family protein [Leptospira wolffii]|nr:TolC family protein [Leptospira wolffii]TGK65555.1 TolC family protein [Leptospira wolffii]TGK74035.1 TolC family protein [Leptospira wolffii]TGL28894.1 TolC family protein [Leptospira wolffii]
MEAIRMRGIYYYFIQYLFLFSLFLGITGDSLGSGEESKVSPPSSTSPGKRISLIDAENLFLRNNLSLLASRMDVESKKGDILQAGLWDNPNFFMDQNAYNRNTGVVLDTTKNGQTAIQIQQLFVLAGKRDKRIRLAKWNKEIAEQTFYDTLRSLKLELRSSFFQLYFARKSLEFYEESIPQVRKTIVGAENVYKSRELLLAELLRLKAILFRLETDRSELIKIILEKEETLRVLLNDPESFEEEIFPIWSESETSESSPLVLETEDLLKAALEYRPDLKGLELAVKAEQTNLSLQKAMAVPDLALGGSWDRAGNYINNYYGVTVSIALPVFDRNQGNIRSSETVLAAKKAALEEKFLKVKAEVKSALGQAKEKDRLLQEYRNSFTKDYKNLAGMMIENYKKRYITILEFSDFFESYSDSTIKMIRLRSDRIDAIENLNYTVGRTIAGEGK